MKKGIYLVTFVLLWSCSTEQNDNNINTGDNSSLKGEEIPLDTNGIKTFHENGKVKEEGLLIDKKKIGLWKNYDENGNLINAFHFFNDSLIFELDKTELDFKSISIAKHNIVFSISKNFNKVNIDGMSENILFAAKKNCDKDLKTFCPNLVVTVENNISYNLKDSINQLAERVKSKFEKFKLINIEKVPSIENSFKITFIGRINNKKLGGVVLAFIKDKKLFNFSYVGGNEEKDEFLKQKDVVDEIIASIKFF